MRRGAQRCKEPDALTLQREQWDYGETKGEIRQPDAAYATGYARKRPDSRCPGIDRSSFRPEAGTALQI